MFPKVDIFVIQRQGVNEYLKKVKIASLLKGSQPSGYGLPNRGAILRM